MGDPARLSEEFDPSVVLSALPESIVEGIIMADKECRILFVNQAACRMLGYSKDELIGRIDYELLVPESDRQEFMTKKRSRYSGNRDSYEIQLKRKDGRLRYFRVHGSPLISRSGETLGTCGTIVDISEERALRIALEHQRKEYQTIFNSVPAMIFYKDTSNRILHVNTRGAALMGMTTDDLEGCSVYELCPSEATKYYEDDLDVIQSKKPKLGIVEAVITKNREKRWLRTDKLPIIDATGTVTGIIVFAVDITQQKRAEEVALNLQWQLLNAQKMEAIGQLAAGVAHDLNNSLTASAGHLQLLRLSDESGNCVSSADSALAGIERASTLVRQLLGFARQGAYNVQEIDLSRITAETVEFLSNIFAGRTDIEIEESGRSFTTRADVAQLTNALTNILINAHHSMPEGGRVYVSFEIVRIDDGAKYGPQVKAGDFVRLSITDSGAGIPKTNLSRIFEPFFTTKRESQGTGLGLSLVYGFMQRCGGWVDVTSVVGRGSIFSLFFPLAEHEHPTHKRDEVKDGSRNVKTALVIDDEAMIGEISAKFLDRAGIDSVVFQKPRDAMIWYAQNSMRIDLIILDMNMPGMDGYECFGQIRKIRRDAKVILFSGFMHDDKVQAMLENGALRFFQKPVEYADLIQWIKQNVRVRV